MRIKVIYILVIFWFFALSCSEEKEKMDNRDLLFFDSYRVKINPYTYTDSLGNSYSVKGDTIYYISIPDTLNNMPEFKWDSEWYDLQTVALFKSPIKVEGNQIVNVNDIVWQWHSGMVFENKWDVKYSEGKNVLNGIINYENNIQPLNKGDYYWAVWGWSSDVTRILFSSRQMWFYVKE